MHGIGFLQDLAVVMIVAGLVAVLCHRFQQPVVLGYILAGVIIGPHTPPFPFIKDQETIKTLADMGVILLMFSLGLEFSLRKLKRIGSTAFLAAFLEILLMVWLGYEVGCLFHWSVMDSIFLGAMLSISSTTIIVKALAELGKSKERFAELIFGILIIEDILAIVMIALLSGVAMTGSLDAHEVAATIGKLTLFLISTLVTGLLAVPRFLGYVARFKSNEMLLIAVLGLCFGFALLAVKLGYSVALGAFIIGAVIAEAREIGRIEILTEPIRDMFSAIFFVAIGLMIDPKMLREHWLPILIVTLVVVLGKIVTCSFGTFVAGNDSRTSLRVGMGLAQIGEFSFIIASLGITLNVTSGILYPVAVAVSAVTALLTPYLIRSADGLVNWFDRLAPRSLTGYLDLYTQWVGQWGAQRERSMPLQLARKWLWLMGLNAALVAAVFVAAVSVAKNPPGWLRHLPLDQESTKAMLWLGSVIVALPLLIAIFRKLQALGLLVAELTVSETAAGERTDAIRAVIAHLIPVAGLIALGLYVLLLSSVLLPPINVLLLLLVVVGLVTWLLWRSFIRIYARAQVSLEQIFSQPRSSRHEPAPIPLPGVLHDANLEAVSVSTTAPAAGKLIRELRLRTVTGASIVGIERNSTTIINPGPDEEIQAGDQVLLMGNRAQLNAARVLFENPASPTADHAEK